MRLSGWALAAGLALVACPACGSTCTLVGCNSVESLAVTLPGSPADLESMQVVGCRNENCWRGSMEGVHAQFSNLRSIVAVAVEPDEAVSTLDVVAQVSREADGSYSVRFEWRFKETTEVRSGDELRISLRDPEGTEVFAVEETARQVLDVTPNGPDCGGVCRQAIIDRRERASESN
jgi:hypothetical protein